MLAHSNSPHKYPAVTQVEFEELRNLPDKEIERDIEFLPKPETAPNLVFEQIQVKNSLNWDVVLNGTYKPDIPSVTFNFVLKGVGPICRVCVNGSLHGAAGRTHKHELTTDQDPKLNLPNAIARPDLVAKTPEEIWKILCRQARIRHTGSFRNPK